MKNKALHLPWGHGRSFWGVGKRGAELRIDESWELWYVLGAPWQESVLQQYTFSFYLLLPGFRLSERPSLTEISQSRPLIERVTAIGTTKHRYLWCFRIPFPFFGSFAVLWSLMMCAHELHWKRNVCIPIKYYQTVLSVECRSLFTSWKDEWGRNTMYSTEDVWSNSQQHSQIQGQNKLCCGPQTIRDIEEMG